MLRKLINSGQGHNDLPQWDYTSSQLSPLKTHGHCNFLYFMVLNNFIVTALFDHYSRKIVHPAHRSYVLHCQGSGCISGYKLLHIKEKMEDYIGRIQKTAALPTQLRRLVPPVALLKNTDLVQLFLLAYGRKWDTVGKEKTGGR